MHWSIKLEIDTPQKSQSPSTFALVDSDILGGDNQYLFNPLVQSICVKKSQQ